MKKEVLSTKQLATLGILSALIFILTYTPLGIIPLPGMAATILHIPVIVGALALGLKCGIFLGGIMGFATLSRAFIAPTSPLDLFFRNPLVSVLPRLMIGLCAYLTFIYLRKYIKKQLITYTLVGIIGALANTFFTLGMLLLVYYKPLNEAVQTHLGIGAFAFIGAILTTHAIGEITVTAILVPVLLMSLQKAFKGVINYASSY